MPLGDREGQPAANRPCAHLPGRGYEHGLLVRMDVGWPRATGIGHAHARWTEAGIAFLCWARRAHEDKESRLLMSTAQHGRCPFPRPMSMAHVHANDHGPCPCLGPNSSVGAGSSAWEANDQALLQGASSTEPAVATTSKPMRQMCVSVGSTFAAIYNFTNIGYAFTQMGKAPRSFTTTRPQAVNLLI